MTLHWNDLHILAREELLYGACINTRFAHQEWEELEDWLKILIQGSLERRSNKLVSVEA